MSINIYVGNLSFQASDADLRERFGAFGTVEKVSIIRDKETGKSRGFAFVEMSDRAAGLAAIDAINDTEIVGRKVSVNEARNKEPKPDGRYGAVDR